MQYRIRELVEKRLSSTCLGDAENIFSIHEGQNRVQLGFPERLQIEKRAKGRVTKGSLCLLDESSVFVTCFSGASFIVSDDRGDFQDL